MTYNDLFNFIISNDYANKYFIKDNKLYSRVAKSGEHELVDFNDILEMEIWEDLGLEFKIETDKFNITFNRGDGHRVEMYPEPEPQICTLCGVDVPDKDLVHHGGIMSFDTVYDDSGKNYLICDKCWNVEIFEYLGKFANVRAGVLFWCWLYNKVYIPDKVEEILKRDKDLVKFVGKYKRIVNLKNYSFKNVWDSDDKEIFAHLLKAEPKRGISKYNRIDTYVNMAVNGKNIWDCLVEQQITFGNYVGNKIKEKVNDT